VQETSATRVAPLTVTIADGLVVVRPHTDLDLDATEALRQAVVAAVASGESVMLAFDDEVASAPSEFPHPASPVDGEAPIGCAAQAVAAGYVRLCAGDEYWTIDVTRHRFCRSASKVDPHFVATEQWTPVVAAWVTAGRTTVMTERGTYVSTTSNWAG
jgi:hypothetical protein